MDRRTIIRLKSMISYAGEVINIKEKEGMINSYELKPSLASNVSILIPSDEIKDIFCMDGKVISGDEIYVKDELK